MQVSVRWIKSVKQLTYKEWQQKVGERLLENMLTKIENIHIL